MTKYIKKETYVVLCRDNFTCQECGIKGELHLKSFSTHAPLEVHHIDGKRDNNRFTNLITLCNECHIYIAHAGCTRNKPKKQYFVKDMTPNFFDNAIRRLEQAYTNYTKEFYLKYLQVKTKQDMTGKYKKELERYLYFLRTGEDVIE